MIKTICGLCAAACFFLSLGFIGTIERTGDLSNAPAAFVCMLIMLIFIVISRCEKWED